MNRVFRPRLWHGNAFELSQQSGKQLSLDSQVGRAQADRLFLVGLGPFRIAQAVQNFRDTGMHTR